MFVEFATDWRWGLFWQHLFQTRHWKKKIFSQNSLVLGTFVGRISN
jgi:hypothetical protein